MTLPQSIFASVLVAVLLGLAGYFGRRQLQALRGLRSAEEMPPEDRRYVRNQAWRRLAGSALMVVIAGFFVGAFFVEGVAGVAFDFEPFVLDLSFRHLTLQTPNDPILHLNGPVLGLRYRW